MESVTHWGPGVTVVEVGVLTGYCRSVTVAFIERVVVLPHLQHVNTLDSEYANS